MKETTSLREKLVSARAFTLTELLAVLAMVIILCSAAFSGAHVLLEGTRQIVSGEAEESAPLFVDTSRLRPVPCELVAEPPQAGA